MTAWELIMILRRRCFFAYIMFLVCVLVSFPSHSAEEEFRWFTTPLKPSDDSGNDSGNDTDNDSDNDSDSDTDNGYSPDSGEHYNNFVVRGTVADDSYDANNLIPENQITNLLHVLSYALSLRPASVADRDHPYEEFAPLMSMHMQLTTFNIFPMHKHIEHADSGLIFDRVHDDVKNSVYVNLGAAPVGATEPSFEMGVILNRRRKSGAQTFIEASEEQIARCYYRPPSYEYRLIVTRYPLTSHEDVERVINNEHTSHDRAPIELIFDNSRLHAAIGLQNVRVIGDGAATEVRRQEPIPPLEPIPAPGPGPAINNEVLIPVIRSTFTGSSGIF
ncbi:hypothetical protein NX722_16070 [Endozoicomonas gorgoniicola]|uniref:Uncharacterized protein n=1 Tax=Endozoicomonas gorgoniicola TaxID=1234144 RepID=A0ABT3MXM0_9GAMM|nr:hypothetical protein [Endozoicomonas gorgoniicola]MCW7554107.1 hypothetical protein [Endozoicomonas gorgoniicola]